MVRGWKFVLYSALCIMHVICVQNHPLMSADRLNDLKPIPSPTDLTAGVKTLKLLYALEYQRTESKTNPQSERNSLARKLLKTAKETSPESVGYYPMLSESIRLATLGGKAEIAFDAIALLAQSHAVDVSALRLEVLKSFTEKDLSVSDVKAASELLLKAIQDAADAQRLDQAILMVEAGEQIAKRIIDSILQKKLVDANEVLKLLKQQELQVAAARKIVEGTPEDISANLTIAKFVGLRNGEWEAAEIYAASVNDDSVRSLFVREISAPQELAQALQLANDWWDFGETQYGAEKLQAQELAASRYETIIGKLAGFDKRQVETRLASVIPKRLIAVRIPHVTAVQIPLVTDDNFTGKKAGDARELIPGMNFRWCPPGSFTMGSPASESGRKQDEQQAPVTISNGFWLGETEVTQVQWKSLMNTSPWDGKLRVQNDVQCPAVYISHDEAMAYCEKLTYQERTAGRLPAEWKYVLPSEAQWEYACRAGTRTKFSFGDNESSLGDFGWFADNADKIKEEYAHHVGLKASNQWGLRDMHGNVWEWCADWKQDNLPGGVNPKILTGGSGRVNRGGGWNFVASSCRSAVRGLAGPNYRYYDLGFRVAGIDDKSNSNFESTPPADGSMRIFLDDIKEKDSSVGYGEFGKHGSLGFDNRSVVVDGVRSTHSLSMHPPSRGSSNATYDLGKKYLRFNAVVALDDGTRDQSASPLTFKVIGDGKVLWRSKPIQKMHVTQKCAINIEGVSVLRLQVDCPQSNGCSCAVWLRPSVDLKDPSK